MKDSLDHLPETAQEAITEIRRLILNEVEAFVESKTGKRAQGRVSWIVLFGSYARGDFVNQPANGYVSDFDVLVTVTHEELANSLGLWGAIEDKAERYTRSPLTLIVHTQEEILRWLEQGHYFFSDIRKEGVYLYSYSGKPLPEAKLLTDKERLPVAQEHYDLWFKSANEFLDAFEFHISKEQFKIAAFNLHQATERLYACLLLVTTNYRPRTHNIKTLHRMAIDMLSGQSALTTIFKDEDRFQKRCFELLRRAYIDSRYSKHYSITLEELQWLFKQVSELKNIVEQCCLVHLAELAEGEG